MLGDKETKQIAASRDTNGFFRNRQTAKSGGAIAGGARRQLEQETGTKVLSSKNSELLKQRRHQKT